MKFCPIVKFIEERLGKQLYLMFVILVIISIYEVLFAFLLIPYFSFLIFGELPNLPILYYLPEISDIEVHAIFWFFVMLRFSVQSLQGFIVSNIVYGVMSTGIQKSFRHFLCSLTDGNDETRIIVKDNEFMSMYIAFPVVNIIFESGVLVFAFVAIYVFYPSALLLVIFFIALISPIILYSRALQRRFSALRVEYDSKVFREIGALISAKRFISTLQLSEKSNRLVRGLTDQLKKAYSKQYTVQIFSKNSLEVFVLLFLLCVILISSTIEQGLLFIIFTIFLRMAQSATRLQMHIQTLHFGSESLFNYNNKLNMYAGNLTDSVFEFGDRGEHWHIKNIKNGKEVFLEKNKIYRLVGASGSGKSTILNCFDSSLVMSGYSNYRYVPQFTSLRAGTIDELDQFYQVKKDASNFASFLLDELNIKEANIYRELDVISRTISGGEAQKLISRVLYSNGAQLLFADELFSNLPIDQEEKLLLILKKKFDTIIYTSHKTTIVSAHEIAVDDLI